MHRWQRPHRLRLCAHSLTSAAEQAAGSGEGHAEGDEYVGEMTYMETYISLLFMFTVHCASIHIATKYLREKQYFKKSMITHIAETGQSVVFAY